jgi:acyl-coenzyme A thioesterase PaaI-like protein
MASIKTFEEELLQMRPSFETYSRVDESILADKELFKIENQALHGTLAGDGLIEVYEVYKKKDEEEILCLIKLGQKLNGYPDIVHGGITALLFDNTFGWVFIALKAPHGVTANLSINYR